MEIKEFTSTLRTEMTALFGIRWDSFVEWAVTVWLSVWFWATSFNGGFDTRSPLENLATGHLFVGPISGISSFLQGLGIAPPTWFADFLIWLHAQGHSWIFWVALGVAVLTCVTSARSYKHTGLRVLALISAAISCEIQGDLWPVLWVVLIASVPALVACSIDWVDQVREKSRYGESQYYFAQGIFIKFLTGIVFLFLKIPVAPIVILGQLVVSFRTEIPRYSAAEITREVARVLETASTTDGSAGVDDLTRAASSAALTLAGNQSPEARVILGHYSYLLRNRREQLDAESRRKAEKSMKLTELRYQNQRAQLGESREDEDPW